MRGFSVFYPDVNASAAPVPYPFTITMVGNNVAVQDVELLNSFNGIPMEPNIYNRIALKSHFRKL